MVKKISTKKSTIRNNPELWESCKAEALFKMGKFSARAMQYAVTLYKKQGGTYQGKKTASNSLVKWTKNSKEIT